MLTALFADIHSNLAALQACLHHARARGAERFVFLGDLVGYGPDPAAVIDVIASIDGAVVVKGNHDEAIEVEPKTRDLNDLAYAVIVWTRDALSAAHRQFLSSLPMIVKEGDLCFVHSSASRPEKWEYVEDGAAAQRSMDAASTPYVFSGHVHDQALYFKTPAGKTASFRPTPGSPVPVPRRRGGLADGRAGWLAIVGSVGQPRDGNPASSYALFDGASEAMTFFRIPYDHLSTANRIRAARLPDMLAERIVRGE
jgi:diadenosine tetraphosphatase ApaH/serine/threonine PP2A family protein phosphatase